MTPEPMIVQHDDRASYHRRRRTGFIAIGRPIDRRLPARLDDATDLGRARAAPTQAGYDDRRTSEQSAARSSGPMIYLDSSVALAYLLAEDRFPPDSLWDQPLGSSRLLECEVWNRINAHQRQNSHGDAVRNLIGRVAIIEMVGPVLARALQPFPVPVSTLDGFTSRRL